MTVVLPSPWKRFQIYKTIKRWNDFRLYHEITIFPFFSQLLFNPFYNQEPDTYQSNIDYSVSFLVSFVCGCVCVCVCEDGISFSSPISFILFLFMHLKVAFFFANGQIVLPAFSILQLFFVAAAAFTNFTDVILKPLKQQLLYSF